jgi:putative ABC transport system permease protein
MRTALNEFRYALRVLYRQPAFALSSIITLALAIGANTAIFSVIHAVLLHPLPFKDSSRLVTLWQSDPKRGADHFPVSVPYFKTWQERNRVFDGMAAFAGANFDLTGATGPERVSGTLVSANIFTVLGTEPMLGRAFLPEDDEPSRLNVAVISYELWQRRFGNITSPVGQMLTTDSATYTIVGVLPRGFRFTGPSDVWVPLGKNAEALHIPGNFPARILAMITPLQVVARLKPGGSLQGAESDIGAITSSLRKDLGSPWQSNIISLKDELVSPKNQRVLFVIQAGVGLVFLIACVNVANLFLAYITNRQRETAARIALGATRKRLVLQLLSESFVLSLCSGLLGLLIAYLLIHFLGTYVPSDIIGTQEIGIGLGVLVFTLAISLLTIPIFGAIPAFRISRPNLAEILREGMFNISPGSRNRRLLGAFVVSEVALAMVLLIATLLTVKSLQRLSAVNLGIEPRNVLTVGISLSKTRYPQPEKQYNFFREVLDQTASLPSVQETAMINFLPLQGLTWQWSVAVEGYGDPSRTYPTNFRVVAGDYFKAMGTPLVEGRAFSSADFNFGANVVILNQAMARQFWPNENPIGHRIKMGDQSASAPWLSIVGVVANVKEVDLTDLSKPVFYVPFRESAQLGMTLVIRTSTDPTAIVPAVRAKIQAIDPDQPVHDIRTMETVLSSSLAPSRFTMLLLSVFSGIAIVLAVVGIYGMHAYSINQRRREIGIRLALGADRSEITRMILRRALFLISLGIGAGLFIAAGLMRFLATLLYEVKPFDAAVFAVVSILLSLVALLTAYLSAQRASTIDPGTALRYE